MLPNSAAFFEVGLGAARARCAVVPVNWHLKQEELTWVVQDSEARLLIADAALAPTARLRRRPPRMPAPAGRG